ncbi:MAG: NAD+ synthase [Candidatus Aminicenantes bacterium]|nr:NAD+ synthase [Candidatus Aminicenantes bacterium]
MKINTVFVEKILVKFIRDELTKFNFKNAILGLSGGLDSTVCAFLASKALKPKNVFGLIMPYGESFCSDVRDAEEVVRILEIHTKMIDISPMVDAYYKKHPTENRIMIGNKMARERMSILYDHSVRESALILGTSNKTELLLGYGTVHGDMACAINPLGDLYKTQIRMLAKHLGVPEKIRLKAPTAGLWSGQTDEEELGMTYEDIDRLLFQLIDNRKTYEQVIALGFSKKMVAKIYKLIRNSEFKRKLPPIAKLSHRTIGHDFLYPYDRDV